MRLTNSFSLLMLIVLCSSNIATASAPDKDTREDLKGINYIGVIVMVPNDEIKQFGLTEDNLTALIELKLRQNGIKIRAKNQNSPDCAVLIFDMAIINEEELGGIIYSSNLEFYQNVKLVRNNKIVLGCTWNDSSLSFSPRSDFKDSAKSILDDHLNIFLNEFFKANPKN